MKVRGRTLEGTAKVRDIPALWRMEPEREVGLHTGAPAILKQPALSPLTFPPSTPHPRWAAAVFMRLPRGSHHLGQLDPWVARGPQVLWGNFSYRISQFPDRSQAPPPRKASLNRAWKAEAGPGRLALLPWLLHKPPTSGSSARVLVFALEIFPFYYLDPTFCQCERHWEVLSLRGLQKGNVISKDSCGLSG